MPAAALLSPGHRQEARLFVFEPDPPSDFLVSECCLHSKNKRKNAQRERRVSEGPVNNPYERG